MGTGSFPWVKQLRHGVDTTSDEIRWILHHDNSPGHMDMAVQQFLTGKQITLMPQPPHSPYLTLGDF
jgi:hypothetical protein